MAFFQPPNPHTPVNHWDTLFVKGKEYVALVLGRSPTRFAPLENKVAPGWTPIVLSSTRPERSLVFRSAESRPRSLTRIRMINKGKNLVLRSTFGQFGKALPRGRLGTLAERAARPKSNPCALKKINCGNTANWIISAAHDLQ